VVYGASGGVFGLIGARVADLVLNMNDMKCLCAAEKGESVPQVFKRVIFGKVGQGMIAIGCSSYAIYDFIQAIVSEASGSKDTTSYGTHLGGLIVGTLVGILALRNVRDERWEKALKIVTWCLLCAFVLISVTWNVFSPQFPAANSTLCHKYLYPDQHHHPLLGSRPNSTFSAHNRSFATLTLTLILSSIRTTTPPITTTILSENYVFRTSTNIIKPTSSDVLFLSQSTSALAVGENITDSTSQPTGNTHSSQQTFTSMRSASLPDDGTGGSSVLLLPVTPNPKRARVTTDSGIIATIATVSHRRP
jgi:hypothetical protein